MSNINPKITEILTQHHIDVDLGRIHLLCLYHNIDDISISSEEVIKRVNLTKIVERDYDNKGSLIWNTPLYENQDKSQDEWGWVDNWREMFGKVRADAIGNKKSCVDKMKKYFAAHPSIRVQDIISASQLYINTFNGKLPGQLTYFQRADYFISKKEKDGTYSSRLEIWMEVHKKNEVENKKSSENNRFGRVVQ